MIQIKIDGQEYRNVGEIEPSVEYDYYYEVKTMDGKIHVDTKGKRTNFTALFFNDNLIQYDLLKTKLMSSNIIDLEVPNGATSSIKGRYIVKVNNDNLKGLLYDGHYYSTGLSVEFRKEEYDE